MSASQRLMAAWAIASKVGWTDVDELEITRRISPAAFSRSKLSAKRFSRSRTLASAAVGDLLASGRLASALPFAGLPRRPI